MLDSAMPYLSGSQRTHARPDLRLEGHSDDPNVSDVKIQGGGVYIHGWGHSDGILG